MARTPIVAGNWKMNGLSQTARDLAAAIRDGGAEAVAGVEKVLCPPFVYLPAVAAEVKGTSLRTGAQDMHWEASGAYTGEVSAAMLREFADYVIIGHSERRAYFCETDDTVNRKLKAALVAGLLPIVCVGETGDERQAGQTMDVLQRQVRGALAGVELPATAVIAYEPVWAIGTGVAATVGDAAEAIGFIRAEVASLQGVSTAESVRILYGGSVSPANVGELVREPEIDGGLVGGASLVAASYIQIVRNVAAALSATQE
jgi:triosephosphate isomerase